MSFWAFLIQELVTLIPDLVKWIEGKDGHAAAQSVAGVLKEHLEKNP